jgi:nucleotide-binding universal stress UspA family protein
VILLCYDGSTDAQDAIDRASELFPGQPATILTVWEPFADVMARSGGGMGFAGGELDIDEIDTASESSARERAREGADRARHAGLVSEARSRPRDSTTIDQAILREAEDIGADAIVVGSRGRTGLKSALLGSVSNALIHHADRAVVVIPSAEVAADRSARRR